MAGQVVPGVHGKIPLRGDFITRRLPATFVQPWDDWLQEGMHKAQTRLPANWLEAYLTSPVWRFVTSAGLLGDSPWAGLVMPSVDRVGRYFPLTVALPLPLDVNPLAFSALYEKWFEAVEDVLLYALDDHLDDLDVWDARLVEHSLCLADVTMQFNRTRIGYGEQWQIPIRCENLRDCFADLLDPLLANRLGEYSLWWSKVSKSFEPSILLSRGLPSAHQFCGLLDGDWSTSGWSSWFQVPMRARM